MRSRPEVFLRLLLFPFIIPLAIVQEGWRQVGPWSYIKRQVRDGIRYVFTGKV